METQADKWEVRGAWCQMCGPSKASCYTRCYLKDGKWLGVEGCPQAGNNGVFGSRSLCAKGNVAMRSLDSSERLLYPMRRIGPKGPGARFERISWEAALEGIAATLMSQKEKYGPESFGILSPQGFPVLSVLGRRFLNVHGSPNYLHSAICFTQRQASANTVVGGPAMYANNSTFPKQLHKTKLLVCWGYNPENSELNQGFARQRLQAQKRGMKVIDIRPLCDPLASKADIWLPVRPGTDLALALGMLNVICGEGLFDQHFVETWCHGFPELSDHVRQFPPEWASQRCGIPAGQIRQVARMIAAADPCAIAFGNGIGDQSRDGHWTIACVQLIGAICGNLGKPGGGADGIALEPLIKLDTRPKTLAERLPRSPEDIANGWPAGASKLVAPEYPRWYACPGRNGVTSAYLQGLKSILTGQPYPLRAVFAQSTNPMSATRNPALVRQALQKVDFYFCMDMFFNSSCDYADYLLPACSQYECSHLLATRNMPQGTFLGISQQVANPPGEAMSDWELYCRLGKACGYGADFWDGDVEGYLREMLAPTGYSLEELRAAPEGIFVPRAQAGEGGLAGEGQHAGEGQREGAAGEGEAGLEERRARMFAGLPHGKVQCVNEVVGGKPNVTETGTLPYLPVYRGPVEGIAETPELAREFPLIFSDVHAHRLANHSYFNDIAQLRCHEPEPWVKMNPQTAARYEIADGDWVRVESRHGWCVLRARLTQGVSPEVLMGRRGWWQGCPELGIPGYACGNGGAEPNVLYPTGPDATDELHSSYGKTALVKVVPWRRGPLER